MKFSVVIPTYNRPLLVARAVRSVLDHLPEAEILVVDDASTVAIEASVRQFAGVRYIRQAINSGPGAARNRGIEAAIGDWVVNLDDDDTLRADAAEIIERALLTTPNIGRYPVIQFRTRSAPEGASYRVLSMSYYLDGKVKGDYTPVLQARAFRSAGLRYPESRIGAEHQLWYAVAERWGIPTWSELIVDVRREPGPRLCSAVMQIRHAREHAMAQERTLADFGHLMQGRFRGCRLRHLLGASTYWLVNGDKNRSRCWSRRAATEFRSLRAAALVGLSYVPAVCAQVLLRGYRRLHRA
jgi:glycosyltransferase involved in cell wall biosynthesis